MIHIPKIVAKILILLLLLSCMTVVAGISWLKAKPRTLPGMDASLNHIIVQQGWPFTIKFGKVHTHWEDWNSPLNLELENLVVTGKDGAFSLTVPSSIARFRVLPLLQGKLRFRHVVLSQPTLEWKIEPSDDAAEPALPTPELSYAAQWKMIERNPVYRASLKMIFRLLEQPSLLPIQRLEANDITVKLSLPEETRTLKRDKIVLRLHDTGEGNELRATIHEHIRNVPAIFDMQIAKESNDVLWAKIHVENFSTDWMSTVSPDLAWYSNLSLSFTGQWNAFIRRTGIMEQADFDLHATEHSSLQFGLAGTLKNLPLFQDHKNIPDVNLKLTLDNLPVERIAGYWPLNIGVNARSWITQNLTKGTTTGSTAEIKLPPTFWLTGDVPADAVHAIVPFEHVNVRIAPDLPPVTDVKGKAEITRTALHVTIDDATLKGSKFLPGATANIPNLGGAEVEQLHIKAKLKGPVGDLLAFYAIQQKKLGKPATFDEKKVKGEAASEITINFPLLQALQITDINYTLHSDITDFNYPNIVPSTSLSNAHFTMDYKDKAMHVEGEGGLNDIPSKITYNINNKSEAAITIANTVNAQDMPKLGFPTIPGATGPIAMNYKMSEKADNRSIAIALDAKDATLLYAPLGFNKPAREALDINLALAGKGDETPTLKSFDINGPSLKARGTSQFDAKGNLKEILFDTLTLGMNQGQLKISRDGDAYILQIAAQTLNMEPLIRYFNSKKDDSSDKTSFTLKGTSRTLLMANGEKFTNVAGSLTCGAEKCTSADLNAKVADNANLTLSLIPGAKESVFSVNTENAGAVMRGLDIIKDIRGGTLTTRATSDAKAKDAPFTGDVVIKDFRIVQTPVLARLLTLGSFTGILDALKGKGISFTKLDGRYTYGNHTYQLNDFKLYGSALGILVNGYADLKNSNIKLSGTLIPAYALNKAIGEVPIVGTLLGKGVLATSFAVEGKLDDPETKVYPLSTLAPGILGDFVRNIGLLPSDKVKQPAATPAPTPSAPAKPDAAVMPAAKPAPAPAAKQ